MKTYHRIKCIRCNKSSVYDLSKIIKKSRDEEEVEINKKWFGILKKRVGQILYSVGLREYGVVDLKWRTRR